MVGENKHTPGPFTVRQPDAWPFDIEVVGPDGEVAWSERRYAHATRQRNLADCMAAVGFDWDKRPEIISALERQLADVHLRAASPEMLEALQACMRIMPRYSVAGRTTGDDEELAAVLETVSEAISKATPNA